MIGMAHDTVPLLPELQNCIMAFWRAMKAALPDILPPGFILIFAAFLSAWHF